MNYICIEGNIGAGKTTFAKRFAEITGRTLILEQFDENPFLASFYSEPVKYGFPLEMSFLAERFKQLNDIFANPDLFNKGYIADYSFIKTLLFAEINLTPEEFYIFKKFYFIIENQLPKPDLFVYLHTDVQSAKQNIEARNRVFEKSISPEYLFLIEEAYRNNILKRDKDTYVINYNRGSWERIDNLITTLLNDIETKSNH